MKKDNLASLGIVALLSTCTIALYITKLESIILGVDIQSYFIFASVMIITALLLLNKEDIVDVIKIITSKEYDKNELPNEIYNFCKHYYFDSEDKTTNYVKAEIENKKLANFLVRYIDKNSKKEIEEYIDTQEIICSKAGNNARKSIYYSNFFIAISVIASYVYDSNIKGILLIAGVLCLANLNLFKKVERVITQNKEEFSLYRNIAEDIFNFKNPKLIMYKCSSLLAIEDDFVTIDDLEVQNKVEEENEPEVYNKKANRQHLHNIEERKSALITIGRNKNSNKKEQSRENVIRL